ncbi:MoaD/ThiS family protein [Pelovirga terrestris]|uniref:MoaD/ThiS family protein n=1 Tax=Pelovirga terrestris TaxID=2771352 RepID=A0A8J6UPT3_9BACT|nr:MoaD/ThiS family protein [Pelovirga terrestris]MBD1400904.1 MoaD/ThiS family protein [Pelovirga terrestris]
MLPKANINLTIKLYGVFRIDRFKEKHLKFPAGVCVDEVVDQLQLNRQLLGIILINDQHARMTSRLTDGDTLALLPLLEGG